MSGSRPALWVVATALALMLGLQPVTTDLYLPALPGIQQDLQAPMAGLQLTMSALILSFGLAQLVWGPISDRWGRRPVLRLALVLYVCASLGCALASDIDWLVALRAAQGATLAAVVMIGRAMVRDLYEPIEGAQVMSRGMSGLGIIAIASMPLGGALAGLWGWRANLLAVASIGLGVLVFVSLRLPETLRQRQLQALQPGPLLRTMGRITRHPGFRAWALLVSCTYAGLFTLLATSSFVFIRTLGLSPMAYGIVLSSNSLAYLLGTVLCRRWIARRGLLATVRRGAFFTLAGSVALLAVAFLPAFFETPPTAAATTAALLLSLCLYAVGHGIHQPCGQTGAVGPFPDSAGTASALAGAVLALTAFAIGLVLGSAFDGSVRFMSIGIALAGLVTTLVAWTLVQRHGATRAEPAPAP